MPMAQVLALATAPDYGGAVVTSNEITLATAGTSAGHHGGVLGDRHFGKRRAVTVVCTGELALAAAEHGGEQIDGVLTRRNIVVDLDALPRQHGTRFTIGATELEVWRDCAPCSLMDEAFGDGSRAALQQRCGISATVITAGTVRIGDAISFA